MWIIGSASGMLVSEEELEDWLRFEVVPRCRVGVDLLPYTSCMEV